MRRLYRHHIILLLLFFSCICTAEGQLSGIKTIPGDYPTITAAVNALNSLGVGSGGVTFNIAAKDTEYISSTISLTATGTAANPITFQKNPATSGANPVVFAYTGGTATPASTTQDGIWRLIGSDYVTINAIDLIDTNTSNPATMEYGYALYKASTTNGCQFVTIKNCTINLNTINNAAGTSPMSDGSSGIIMMSALYTSATTSSRQTSATGTNSGNKFYGNTIKNCNTGIALIGYATSPYTIVDTANDIGGSSPATGNTIVNFGGAPGALNACVGIRTSAQYNLNVSYNTINNNNGSGTNHPNIIRGILIGSAISANETITYNTVTVNGGGTTQNTIGIENDGGSTAAGNTVSITNNIVTNCTYSTATSGALIAIYNNGAAANLVNITDNTISNNNTGASTNGTFYCIYNTGAANAVSIRNNLITSNSTLGTSTGVFSGIYNNAAGPSVTISANTITGAAVTATAGIYYAVYNAATVINTLKIDSNKIGTATSDAITFNATNTASNNLLYISKAASTCVLSITGNDFRGITYASAGSGSVTLIANSASTLSQAINYNTFTNLSLANTGSVTFISNNVKVGATGVQNVNYNAISGTFVKTGIGGSVTLFTSTTASAIAGAILNNNNNNFSNITVSGTTTISGWVHTDAGICTISIQNDTFSNWTGGTGSITAMNVNITSSTNGTNNNLISNISCSCTITGITTAAGNDNIYNNTIHTLNSSTATAIIGISVAKGTVKSVYGNKIYDLQSGGTTGSVYGISVSGSTVVTTNLYNNIIGDLRVPTGNSTSDLIRGLSLTANAAPSNINVYYNTIYLNATSSGTNFSTTGIYHATSTTATTGTLDLRNNIIVNNSTPNGTGIVTAYRRSSATLTNYAGTSDNNLYFGGPAASNQLIFYDGTNKDQQLSTYQARASTRDASSVTEDLSTKFISTNGSSANYLHLNPAKATQTESGGAAVSGYDYDFDSETRQGSTGYSGTGNAPDIGADEFNGISLGALSGSYTVGTGGDFTSLTETGGFFAAVNTLGLAGNITVNVISDLSEDGSNTLFQWAEQGAGNYTITIQPNAPIARTISGNCTTGLVKLSGADRVTFDGSFNGSGNYLTIRNTNTAGTTGTAFTFINGASNNTISNCTAEAYANATNGVILFSTSVGITGGNSNNIIDSCNINATIGGNTGNVAIYSAGTSGNENNSNTISNCNIYNYRDRGIDITATGSTLWTISGNSLYNGDVSASINYAAASTLHGIRVLGGSGYTIKGNYIGGNAAKAAGTSAAYSSTLGNITFQGILLTTSAASPISNIKGNTIANITESVVPTSTTASNIFVGIESNGSSINIGGTLSGDGNTIGSNTVNGSISVTTTTSTATFKSNIRGINCNSTGGQVSGNQVGGIDIQNIGTAPGPSTFNGIIISNATAPTPVSNNIVGSTGTGAASNSIRVVSTSTATSTAITGIAIASTVTSTVQVSNNIIQNVSHLSTTTGTGSLIGISSAAITPAVISIINNKVTGNTTNASGGVLYGINTSGTAPSVTISSDTISNNVSTSINGGSHYCIYNTGNGATTSISNNIISGNSTGLLTTGLFICIYNTGTTGTLNITGNTIYGNSTTAVTGVANAIVNTAAVPTAININANVLGLGSGTSSVITYNGASANSGSQVSINNTGGTSACALSISNNTFNGVNYATAGTGSFTFISNIAATLSQAINGNTFASLNVNTTGNNTLITNSVVVSATGTQNVNNNSISGTYTKAGAGGTLTLFTSSASSVAGAVVNNSNNNFSNITVSGATVIAGWVNTDAGAATKSIQNNTFSKWTGGTGAVTALNVSITASGNSVSSNTISNISSAGAITGITTAGGNDNIYANLIDSLTSSTASVVTGIAVTAGTTKNIYKNKIYDLQAGGTTGSVNGILISGTASSTVTIYNNLIGNLRVPTGASSTDLIRGISITSSGANSSVNVYYNTIYLSATSSGNQFSTTGLYHTASSTATTAALTLRNNIIVNYSDQAGSGNAVAFRRSAATLNNLVSTSNNNLFYGGNGNPANRHLIYSDGTNTDQLISTYKTRMSPRETSAVTEDVASKFLSTVGGSAVFLHINSTVATAVESGGANITGFSDDFDGQIRAGNAGYTGTSSSPDIGADEIFGVENTPPTITYTALSNTTSTTNRSLASVTITDGTGVNVASGSRPRIYYKRFSDANTYLDNTSSTNGWKYTETTDTISPFNFTINYNLLYKGATSVAGVIQYFVVAQDIATTPNTAINSGTFTVNPSGVALTSAAFPITGTINSYNIPFSGTYNVGSSEVFTSLTQSTGVFALVNTAGLGGDVTFTVTSDLTEDGSSSLNQWAESGIGNYIMTIQPDGATVRNITGNVTGSLIQLNGANRVRIDGSNGSNGQYLSIKNTNTSGTGTAITFINGAANDTIKYCTIAASTDASRGVIMFSTSATTGNSYNLIDHNDIIGTSNGSTGKICIYSSGSTGFENTSDIVSNNNIYNYSDRAIDINANGSTGWTISGNNLYNGDVTASINYASGSTLHGIRILGGSGYSIVNNYIGGNTAGASGTNAALTSTGDLSYEGISLTTSSASPASYIKGNTISGFTITAGPTIANSLLFTGIETNGSGINVGGSSIGEGNTIGSNTTNAVISLVTSTTATANTSVIKGINYNSSGGLINSNQIGGFNIRNIGSSPAGSLFTGIYFNNTTGPATVSNNIIGSAGSGAALNSIRVATTSTALNTSISGITAGPSIASSLTLNANIIQNVSILSSTCSGSFTGISNTSSGASALTISNNTISAITAATNPSNSSLAYVGIYSAAPSTIDTNIISSISLPATGSSAQLIGINVAGVYNHTIAGNTILSLSTSSTKPSDIESDLPDGFAVVGILSSATGAAQVISGNNISGLSDASVATAYPAICGIGVTGASSGNIYGNRINTLTNTATGATIYPGIAGLIATGGTYNVYNNAIRINNGANTNGVRIYCISHAATSSWNYFFNSARVSGNSNAAVRSAALLRSGSGSLIIKNNIFANIRTGNGNNYAISNIVSPPGTGWTGSNIDYNDIYSTISANTAEWGTGTSETFANWQSISGSGLHSVNSSFSIVTSASNLQPDSATNCNLNNTGIPITTPIAITQDINGLTRNSSKPDLGAYEFTYYPFAVHAGNNGPACTGSSVSLTTDPGTAVTPSYSWRNPSFVTVATTQNPTVSASAGYYKVTVTDINGCAGVDSTLVALNVRPTARMTLSAPSLCEGSSVNLNITVTGTDTVSGTLSDGETFATLPGLLPFPVFPTSNTTYYIISLSDSNCSSLPVDIPDTLSVSVTHAGDWLGAVSTDWNNPSNWCGGIPADTTDVKIYTGTGRYPVISSGTAYTNDLTLQSGTSLTVSSATLYIGGNIYNNGTFTATSCTVGFSGDSAQVIPAGFFSGNVVKNLIINNAAGVSLSSDLSLTGVLTPTAGIFATNGHLKLLSNATQTALISGSGSGSVSGTVTMQRYLPSSFGYRYISAPFQAATVSQLSAYVSLIDTFPRVYYYNENKTSSGWTIDTVSTNILSPATGYAVNLGSTSTPETIQLSGTVNNGTIATTLYNHNQIYTLGFNLVGNPYPSPIDWNAATGLTRTNIDNAIYYFNPSTTDQYGGTYSSYINGISSDGVATNIIPSMQGFFVHVTNGVYPVTGMLTFGNACRVSNLTPAYHRATSGIESPLIRVIARLNDDTSKKDAMVVYFNDQATDKYDIDLDALKILNTDAGTPNLYAAPSGGEKLSICAVPPPSIGDKVIPLGIETLIDGSLNFTASDIQSWPFGLHPFLVDAQTGEFRDLETSTGYRIQLAKGKYTNRFFLVFSYDYVISVPGSKEKLIAYSTGSNVYVYSPSDKGTVIIYNTLGQIVTKEDIYGKGYHYMPLQISNGIYIITLYSEKGKLSKKLFIGNE